MMRLLTLLVLFLPFYFFGQKNLYLSFNDQKIKSIQRKIKKTFESKQEIAEYLNKIRYKAIKKGYVLASIDTLYYSNDTAYVRFYLGEVFKRIEIKVNKKDQNIVRGTPRINERFLSKLPFKPREVKDVLLRLNEYLNENGYPFSKVYLKIDTLKEHVSYAQLHIEKGPFITLKEIHIRGESKVREKYIFNALSIKEGDPYNESILSNISSKIDQIQFVKEIKPHEILFTPEGADLYLYLESVPVSLINGIVGLQPNPITEKTTVTGDVRLKLLNIVKRGEELKINWKSLQPKTQELNLGFNFPFLFNTPFGIDTEFDLYKQDSTFLTTNLQLGIRYFLTGGSYLKAFYTAENSNLLSGANNSLSNNFSTVSSNRYGLGIVHNNLDYLPNPSKGLTIDMDASVGNRKSRPIQSDSTTNATVFKAEFHIAYYVPITPRNVLKLANTTQSYYAPRIYENELFRFGGLKHQRGFNEEVLFATTTSTFTLEYRFLVDKNSHAFAFFDQSFYENNAKDYTQDQPFGFGAGFSFGTNLGIFSISYALGKQFNNDIQLRDGKVHFGYIAYF